ncbi:MAG: hypothetical protein ACPH5J_07925, partial [Candidatus Puniceispirillum sp.]
SSLCLILAGWMFFVKSEYLSGHIINDPLVDRFIPIIEDTPDSDSYVTAMLEIDSIFNADLIRHDAVVETIKNWYRQFETDGIDACLRIAAKEAQ